MPNTEEVQRALRERKSAKGKFTRASNGLQKALVSKAPLKTAEKRMADLVTVWNEVQEKHENYLLL